MRFGMPSRQRPSRWGSTNFFRLPTQFLQKRFHVACAFVSAEPWGNNPEGIGIAMSVARLFGWFRSGWRGQSGSATGSGPTSSSTREMVAVGAAAEEAVERFFRSWSWTPLRCKLRGGRGFDHVFIRSFGSHRHLLIVETKANTSALVRDQMSSAWIQRKIQEMKQSGDAGLSDTADLILKSESSSFVSRSEHVLRPRVRRSEGVLAPVYEVSISGFSLKTPVARIVMAAEVIRVASEGLIIESEMT